VQKGTRGLRQTAWNASIQLLRNLKLKGNKYSIKNYFLLFEKRPDLGQTIIIAND